MKNRKMRKRSRVCPPKLVIPAQLRGAAGCYLDEATVNPKTGPEVCLVVLDSGMELRRVIKAAALAFEIEAGSTQTEYGPLGFCLIKLLDGDRFITGYTMFINPHDPGMMTLLKESASQERLFMLLVASDGSNVPEVLKSNNLFAMPGFIADLDALAEQHPEVDFAMAKHEFECQNWPGD